MNEQGANAIVESSEAALGFVILLGGVRARETQVNATGCKHSGKGMIDELGVIISLNRFDGKAELCLDNATDVGEPMTQASTTMLSQMTQEDNIGLTSLSQPVGPLSASEFIISNQLVQRLVPLTTQSKAMPLPRCTSSKRRASNH